MRKLPSCPSLILHVCHAKYKSVAKKIKRGACVCVPVFVYIQK